MSSSLSVVVLFSDISRALYRVLVSTFPEINLLLMGRGTSQAKLSLPRALSQSSDVFCVAFFLSLSFSHCVRVQKQLVELP